MPLQPIYLEDIASTADLYRYLVLLMTGIVGEYSYTVNGTAQTDVAIYVVQNRDTDPPREWARTGIEILIYEPKISGHNYLGATGLDQIFEMKVIQHDRSTSLGNAKATLLTGLPLFTERSHLGSNAQDNEELNLYQVQTHLG